MEDREIIEGLVNQTIKLEDAYDDSMFAYFANDFIEQYSTKRSLDVINFFDSIIDGQTEKIGLYGDADVTITKLDIKNIPKEKMFNREAKITYSAIQLIVECNDYAFFVISRLRDRAHASSRTLSVYYCPQNRVDSINLTKVLDDPRGVNFCFEVKINFYGEEDSYPDVIRFYDFPHNTFYHFKKFYNELRSISKYGFEEDEM